MSGQPRGLIGACLVAVACAAGARVKFSATDPTFQPRPGARPAVFDEDNVEQVPRKPMRSVGRIEVTVTASVGRQGAADAAAEKGRELGCWILIEHNAYEHVRSATRLQHGATIQLVHGPAPHIGAVPNPTSRYSYHCIVPTVGVDA